MQIIDQKYNAKALNFPFESIINVGAGHLNAFRQKKTVRSHVVGPCSLQRPREEKYWS